MSEIQRTRAILSNLTLKELKEQRDIFVEILKKNISYLNKLLVLDK